MPDVSSIGIDCRFAATQSGHGRYTRELVPALLQGSQGDSFVLFVRSKGEGWLKGLSGSCIVTEAPYEHYSVAEQRVFPRRLRTTGIDLLFSPHFNVPFFCPIPFVVTIHDLILHMYPNQASILRRLCYRAMIGKAVRKARGIITVSSFTAEHVKEMYGADVSKKITVIPNGVSSAFTRKSPDEQEHARKRYDLSKQFYLYVGNAKEHKNVQLLIDAYASLDDHRTDLVLVTSGPEVSCLTLPPGVRILSDVAEADLPALYSAARAFVSASAYEGFGLPATEAEACGCPVIATNRGALPEVLSAHALLVEPDLEHIRSAMMHPPDIPETPVKRYSWQETAERTLALLHNLS